jgi:hypothetical protein
MAMTVFMDDNRELVMDVYPPILYVHYDVPEVIPFLGILEKTENLEILLDNDYAFLDVVESKYDPALSRRLKAG